MVQIVGTKPKAHCHGAGGLPKQAEGTHPSLLVSRRKLSRSGVPPQHRRGVYPLGTLQAISTAEEIPPFPQTERDSLFVHLSVRRGTPPKQRGPDPSHQDPREGHPQSRRVPTPHTGTPTPGRAAGLTTPTPTRCHKDIHPHTHAQEGPSPPLRAEGGPRAPGPPSPRLTTCMAAVTVPARGSFNGSSAPKRFPLPPTALTLPRRRSAPPLRLRLRATSCLRAPPPPLPLSLPPRLSAAFHR